ncbi:MAG TPA: helix-turn-helix transcriptional regulator [Nitrobacter sp.]|nr:helix-turn-helix transcriptional regulator [Nitrobacter sp.]
MLRDLDAPDWGDAATALPPFQAGGIADAKLTGNVINRLPCDRGHIAMMGQTVPFVKDAVSRDFPAPFCEHRRMSEWLSQAEFEDRFCARIQRLRVERGWTQEQMATAIGVPHERYKKYETRSPMPLYLLPRFAMQVDREIEYLVTGKVTVPGRRGPRTLVRTGTSG